MDFDKARELCDLMYEAMPDVEATFETLFDAFAMLVAETIVNEVDSMADAVDAFKHVSERIIYMITMADAMGDTNWSDKGAMQ